MATQPQAKAHLEYKHIGWNQFSHTFTKAPTIFQRCWCPKWLLLMATNWCGFGVQRVGGGGGWGPARYVTPPPPQARLTVACCVGCGE